VLNRANSIGGLSVDDIAGVLGTKQFFRLPSLGAQLTHALNDGRQMATSQFAQAFDPLVERVREMSAVVTGR
jgi:hypothetical protein